MHEGVAQELRKVYAPKSKGPLQSALNKLAEFAEACPDRVLFVSPKFSGDLEAAAHNEWTLILLVWYMVQVESQSTGKTVKVKTIQSYISLLKGYLSFEYSFDLVDRTTRLGRLVKYLLSEDPLGGVRRKRRGFRRRHLRRLGRTTKATATDVNTVNKVAAVSTAWHTLARGGEVAPSVKPAGWTHARHPTRADLKFIQTRAGRRYAVLWLRPLKKKGAGIQPKVPQYIAEYDGKGSDTYRSLQRLEQYDPVPEAARATTPLFRQQVAVRGGQRQLRHMSCSQFRAAVREMAKAIGYTDTKVFGAHSPRIGGATDLASTGKASALLLRAKGRWASDIGAIYARLTRRSLLAASDLMQKSKGRDLEDIFPDFVQPA